MSSNLKVGYILEYFPARSETFILNELRTLKKLGVEPIIIQLSPYKDLIQVKSGEFTVYPLFSLQLSKIARELPNFILNLISKPTTYLPIIVKVLGSYPNLGFKMVLRAIVFQPKISKIARRESINHFHAHFTGNPALFAMLASKVNGITYSFTVHGKSLFVNPFLIKEKVAGAKFVASISEFNKKYMIKKFKLAEYQKKIKVIRCGVASSYLKEKKGPSDHFLRIITVSRLAPKKGIDDILRALNVIKNLGINFQYRIIGAGILHSELVSLTKRLGISDEVIFLGSQPSETVFKELSKADVFVLTPKSKKTEIEEGIPVVLMEAGLAGLPVISSKIAGIPELIEHGKNGFLINQGDYEKLAVLLATLYKNPYKRTKLGNKLGEKVRKDFNLQENVSILYKNYVS